MISGSVDFTQAVSPQIASDCEHVTAGPVTLFVLGNPRLRDAELARRKQAGGWAALAEAVHADPQRVAHALAGRYALVWWHGESRQLGLLVDRFATISLCYARRSTGIDFAHRADALPGVARDIDPQALFDYLHFHCIPAARTIFSGVRRLPAGHMLIASADGVSETAWWRPQFTETPQADFGTLREEFRTIIRTAVEREAQGARTAAFLSGGTDSSTVVGMFAQTSKAPVHGYSIGFEAEGYDEMEYARIAARHYGIQHREYYITPDDLVAGIPSVAAHYDQPFGNSSALPAYYCAKLAREEGHTRMLAGDGGDELFGGNKRYAKQRVFDWYENIPAVLRNALLEPALRNGLARSLPVVKKASSYVEQARTPFPDRDEGYNLLDRLGIAEVLTPALLNQVDTRAPLALKQAVYGAVSGATRLNRQLAYDWRFTLADCDLPKVIGTTEFAGIGVAFPLLSDELVDFSLRLPTSWKLRGFKLRWFFKEALRGFLPDAIITKPKQGFGLPFGPWALRHAALNAQSRDALASLANRGIIRSQFLDTLMHTHLPAHPGYYGEMVWICIMLEHWLRAHAPDYRIAP